jgi:hypothetical protein
MRSPQKGGPPSAQPSAAPPTLQRYTLTRGGDERPLQFDGALVAESEAETSGSLVLRAAIYRAKDGRYVSEFSRRGEGAIASGKAGVFGTLDDALAWFRPGKLTTALRKQLGRWEVQLLEEENAETGEDNMPLTTELIALLDEPNETLTVEHKSWLDLGETRDRAVLAKAAIALANSGGGTIVLGMRHREGKGPLESVPRPAEVDPYTQDDVNQAVNRFADPEFHCELSFAVHPVTKVEHAFVRVPGNLTVPVMSRRDCEGVISARRCYVRKPGPRSEEPLEAKEWRVLFDRCVRAGRDEMMNAIRLALHGGAGRVAQPAAGEALTAFTHGARQRWAHLVQDLPANDPARFPHGHYTLGFELLSEKGLPSLSELRRAMQQASSIKHTGWGPFALAQRTEFEPRIVDGAIEAWFGLPVERVLARDPAHVDYWRADTTGKLVLLRGYEEDGQAGLTPGPPGVTPGTVFDITLPVWRVGEAILYVGRLADCFGDNDGLSFLVHCRYLGLRGRTLVHLEGRRMILDPYRCADDEVTLTRQITRAEARDNLVEVLHRMLSPLYERFSFFELSERLVAEEVDRMTRNRF